MIIAKNKFYANGGFSQIRSHILRNIIMINHRLSEVWSTTKPIAAFSCTPRVQEVHTKAEVVTPYPWSPRLRGIIQLSGIGNVLRNI